MYSVLGISKQAHSKAILRERRLVEIEEEIFIQCTKVREKHKVIGCRKMHGMIRKQIPLGRDRFMQQCRKLGLFVKRRRSPHITTHSSNIRRFPNLADGKVLTGPNQLWQSDFFYVLDGNKHKYGITIIDVYTRELLALTHADNLRAYNLHRAIKQALKKRSGQNLSSCIFHSDGGKQYEEMKVMTLLSSNKIKQSMCIRAQQNAYAERVQGTIKHEYLFCNNSQKSLLSKFKEAMYCYNNLRPHSELGGLTPTQYEQQNNTNNRNRPRRMQVYQWREPMLTF